MKIKKQCKNCIHKSNCSLKEERKDLTMRLKDEYGGEISKLSLRIECESFSEDDGITAEDISGLIREVLNESNISGHISAAMMKSYVSRDTERYEPDPLPHIRPYIENAHEVKGLIAQMKKSQRKGETDPNIDWDIVLSPEYCDGFSPADIRRLRR